MSDEEFKRHKMKCPYLQYNRCSIYPFRPLVCRLQGTIPELYCPHNKSPLLTKTQYSEIMAALNKLTEDIGGTNEYFGTRKEVNSNFFHAQKRVDKTRTYLNKTIVNLLTQDKKNVFPMKTCSSCKKKNPDDATFCQHCGTKLKTSSKSQFEQNIEHFGEEMEQIGKKLEQTVESKNKRVESWYDTTFGFFAPILSALIAFVILYIIINIFSFFGQTHPWMGEISSFLESLLLVFLAIFFLSSYSNYFTKKFKPFRFISPVIGAIVFMVWFWAGIQILAIIATHFGLPVVQTFSDLFEALIFPLAILILLLGYIGVVTSSKQEQYTAKKNQTVNSERITKQTETQKEYKRLYRSGTDRILGGVLGGLAEYLTVDPTIIRVLYVLLVFASVGFIILAYLVGWILIPRNPNHDW